MSTRPLALAVVLLSLSLSLSRCACFEETAGYNQVVFSDDDTALLIAELRYEERQSLDPLAGTTEKQNFRTQLFTSARDGSGVEPLGDEEPGQIGAELYFMHAAGYALVTHYDESGAFSVAKVDESGARTTLPDGPSADPTTVFMLPSPSGAHIAQLALGDNEATVRFLDASDLSRVGDDVTERFAAGVEWTFRPDGALVLTDRTTARALFAGEAPVDTTLPGCLSPKTSSSSVAEDGTFVFASGPAEVSFSEPASEQAFGCQ